MNVGGGVGVGVGENGVGSSAASPAAALHPGDESDIGEDRIASRLRGSVDAWTVCGIDGWVVGQIGVENGWVVERARKSARARFDGSIIGGRNSALRMYCQLESATH
jgi:hypothetical protein